MKFGYYSLFAYFIICTSFAQMPYEIKSYKFKDSPQAQTLAQKMDESTGTMGSSQDETEARNLLVLRAVLNFKMQDQKLKPYFEKLKNNKEFYQKLQLIMRDLDNSQYRDSTNDDIISILNSAGNSIYNNYAY